MTINIEKIIQIESGGDVNAYNPKSNARGLMQITQPVIDDWNSTHKEQNFRLEFMFTPDINKLVGTWYLNERIPSMFKAYNIPDCEMTRLIAYNWGIGNLRKWYDALPDETYRYLEKYFEQ